MRIGLSFLVLGTLTFLAVGCGTPTRSQPIRFGTSDGDSLKAEGLDNCGRSSGVIQLDPSEPLVILVHGCNSSSGRFRALAGVFEAHRQQAICFTYDDRASLEVSSERLIRAINALRSRMKNDHLTVLGHSQGGLVTRRALVRNRSDEIPPARGFRFRVVTVSSPFNGIAASSHCSLTGLHVASLGISALLCRFIAGAKWREIHAEAAFMRHPGGLSPEVFIHLKVVTDERHTCRVFDEKGLCVEDDFVFSIEEQYHPTVDRDRRTHNVEVNAGHVEIVGDGETAPLKLLSVLEQNGVLAPVPVVDRASVARQIAEIYRRF